MTLEQTTHALRSLSLVGLRPLVSLGSAGFCLVFTRALTDDEIAWVNTAVQLALGEPARGTG